MKNLFWNALKLGPVAFAATLFVANSAFAAETEKVTSVAQLSEQANSIGQVTSVSKFSDVQPTDWAFQALQSLVERYGCIAGYPNSTFRGNRAMTRYEFAAGLNACLDRVNELIATATADLVKKEDLEAVKALQEEFSAELATLRGRVDALDARTSELESKQFSTTMKLSGEVIFNLATPFGTKNTAGNDLNSNVQFSDRVRLTIGGSFTGSDRLNIRLNARNTTAMNGVTGTNMTNLGIAGGGNNEVSVDKLNYAFNLNDNVRVQVDASNGEFYSNMNTFNPLMSSSSRGSISRYGRFSPIYRQGAGGAGATVNVKLNNMFTLSGGYMASNANNPANGLNAGNTTGNNTGSSAAIAQLAFKPVDQFNLGLTYARSYNGSFQSTGSAFANNGFITSGARTDANHYGVQATYNLTKDITLGGWYGFSDVDVKTGANAGRDADINYWAAHLGFKDFGGDGNLLGFIVGQSPKVTGLSGTGVTSTTNTDRLGTSFHLETLYRMQLNDNMSITPGLLVIFNPEHNSNNPTQYVGTLRTTFTF